ncbi:DUF4031 domain-containing protein [Pseudomonas fluorescens]|uniref:DUF4031 domain-containing protein n=1 Tax=Pseudomonas frederiksbergensis TaxID=104087 RepID=UPI0009BDFDE8
MTVYVDAEGITWRGRLWSHLVADSLEELHAFASTLGLQRRWFQSKSLYPHYDVTASVRDRALAMGALGAERGVIVACAKRMRSEMIAAYRASLSDESSDKGIFYVRPQNPSNAAISS